jgi:hypothetical protein
LKLWILLSYLLAGFGALAFGRSVRLPWAASAITGIAFALSGPLVSSSDNVTYLTSYAALPLAFACLQRFVDGGGRRWLLCVALSVALCAAGGDPQAWGILLALLVPYGLAFSSLRPRRRALWRSLSAVLAGAVLSAPFVLPVLLWLPYADRAAGIAAFDLARWNLAPARLTELFLPNLFRGDVSDPISPVFQTFCGNDATPLPWFLSVYLGASVLSLSALGVASDRKMRWLLAFVLLLGWAALGHHAGFGQLASRLPVLGAFRFWEKLVIWIALAAALSAGRGVAALLERRRRWPLPAFAAAAGCFLLLWIVAIAAPNAIPGRAEAAVRALLVENVRQGALHAGVVLALLAALSAAGSSSSFSRLAPAALAILVLADLFGGNAGAYVLGPDDPGTRPPLASLLAPGTRVLTPFSLREDRWPELGRLKSTWEWGRRTLAPSWNVELLLDSPHDYVGLREARWSTLREAEKEAPEAPRLGLFGFDHVVVPGNLRQAERAGVPADAPAVAFDPELPAWVVTVPHRPRAYLARTARQVSREEAFRFALEGGVEGEVVVESPLANLGSPSPGTARIEKDLPGETQVLTNTSSNALLVLNDAFAPGWSATVDGSPASILRANWVVRAVEVQKGAHLVRFHYRTPGLRLGWILSLLGTALLCAWAFAGRMRRAQ